MPSRFIYLHGFASGPGSKKAQVFREHFQDRGIHLEIPDLAESGFERLTITGQLDVIEREARGEPVCLIGSSLGGYLAALYAARHPEVERLLLLAPAFAFAANLVSEVGTERAAQWRKSGWMPYFNYAQGAESRIWWHLVEDARNYEPFPETTQPVLIFHGRHDKSVPPALSREFVRQRADAKLELVDSDHELLNVVDRIWGAAEVFFELDRAVTR